MNEEQMIASLVRMDRAVDDIAEIKDSMKVLAAAVNRLAVIEERQSTDRAEISRAFKRLDNHDGRLRVLEQALPMSNKTTEWVEKVFWLVIGAVASAAISTAIVKSGEFKARDIPVISAPK